MKYKAKILGHDGFVIGKLNSVYNNGIDSIILDSGEVEYIDITTIEPHFSEGNKQKLTKKQFVTIMDALQKQIEYDSQSTEILAKVFRNDYISGYDNGTIVDATIKLVEELMGDVPNKLSSMTFVSYFIWEMDFGKKVMEGNDDIADAGKLYDYLCEGVVK